MRASNYRRAFLPVLTLAIWASTAAAVPSINTPSFLINAPYQFNGSCGLVQGSAIKLINGTNKDGGFFIIAPQDVTQSFTATYTFAIQNPIGSGINGGNGFAFVIQGDSRGATALGGGDTQLGYGDGEALAGNAIQNSLAVSFTTGSTNKFQILDNPTNGNIAIASAVLATQSGTEPNLGFGNSVTVNYDAPNITFPNGDLSVLLNGNSIGLDNVALPASLQSLVGAPNGLFGFTASSGATDGADISIDGIVAGAPVPEPASLSLLSIAAMGVLVRRRRV